VTSKGENTISSMAFKPRILSSNGQKEARREGEMMIKN
jgi:hypothetical protein